MVEGKLQRRSLSGRNESDDRRWDQRARRAIVWMQEAVMGGRQGSGAVGGLSGCGR